MDQTSLDLALDVIEDTWGSLAVVRGGGHVAPRFAPAALGVAAFDSTWRACCASEDRARCEN
jgi:hypothetical protein